MKYQKFIKIAMLVMLSAVFVQAGVLTQLGGTKGQADKELKNLEKKFKDADFSIAAKNEHLEMHYYNEFKDKNLDLLNFYRIYNKKEIRDFLLANPDYGAYTPFNFLAFKKLPNAEGGDTTWYGHLNVDTMLDIIGEKDQSSRDRFKKMMSRLDRLVKDEMQPTATKELTFDNPLPKHTLLKMVMKFDNDDTDEFVEEFIMKHDSLFTKHHFVIAGFLDLKFEFDDMDMEFDKYDAYWVSSLCHFEFSNAVFNHGEPQAGVFAPCSIYFYIPKGTKELHVGYATVDNWLPTTGIKDKEQIKYMKEIAQEVQKTFEELGFVVQGGQDRPDTKKEKGKDTNVKAELSELKTMVKNMQSDIKELKEILKHQEPSATPKASKKEFKGKPMSLDDTQPEKLSAYFVANTQPLGKLKERLQSNGFEILSSEEILDGKVVLSVTNEKLKSANSFMSVINILHDGSEEIRVQNPSYLAAAYLKDSYKYGDFKNVLQSLQAVLGAMYRTDEVLPFEKLKDYNYKPNMPKFEDIVEIEEGDDLADRVTSQRAKKYVAYSLKLPNGSLLIGHLMRERVNKFLNKIDEAKNAQLLPYQSMIKDQQAYMLDPTYYLALSLPMLSMEEFMQIASTPDAITRAIRRAYR